MSEVAYRSRKITITVLIIWVALLILLPRGLMVQGRQAGNTSDRVQVTVNEDLMREHGLLQRVLLIYEEIDRRLQANDPRLTELGEATGIVKNFIEDYHEKLEEEYLFPRFEKAGKQVDLVQTLRAQHDAGRKITARLQAIAAAGAANPNTCTEAHALIHAFIRMYRPHAAREDTVLFPAFSSMVTAAEYRTLGETFANREKHLFGAHGFESMVEKVTTLEKSLGINQLSQFTPKE